MKKISRRNFLKVTAAGAVGAAALSLTGCGGSKDNGTTASSTAASGAESKGYNLAAVDSSKNTEVVLWHNRGGKAGELLEQTMIPKFNETVGKEMGITVTPVYQSSSDLISKVKALILAKDVDNLPDMVQVFAGDAEYMSTVPYVVPAQSLIEADESFDGSELLPQLVNTYTLADTLWSLPFHASTMVMYYNKTAYAAAGLDPETPPTTLAEFADMAAKLKSNGQYAITFGIQNTYLNHFIGGQGEYSFIGDHENGRAGRMTKVVFDEEGTMKNFLTEWSKVLATGAVQTTDEGTQARDEFMAGTSATLFTSNNVLESMISTFAEQGWELGVADLPKVQASDKGGVCPGGSSIYALDRGDAQKVAKSWEFMKQWVSADYQTEWALGTGCIPVNQKSMDTDDMKAYVEGRPEFDVAFSAMMNSNPKVQEHLAPTQQAFTTTFKEVGAQFAAGSLSIDDCVAEMAKQCNEALDEYNRANHV